MLALTPGGALAASAGSEQYIREAKAKAIALEHAKITEAQATFINAHLDYDDGRVVYDIEFYSGKTEYDYEIDALNGDIREFDYEIEYYSIPKAGSSSTGTEGYIGEEKAKAAALKHAGVAEARATHSRI